MKKYFIPFLIILLVVLQIISLARIGDLQWSLRETNNQLAFLEANQSNQMNNIYANIDSMLKRQSSIVDSYDYSFGKVDPDKLTVPVIFKITPKELKADTEATLYVSDESVVMSKNGTTFTGTVGVDIFEPIEARVILADGGTQKIEKLEIVENPLGNVLPTVHARFEREGESALYKISANQLSGTYYAKGTLSVEVEQVNNNTIEKARLVVDIDGKVIFDEPINTDGHWTQVDEQWNLSAGETLTMSVIATDSLGLNHETIIDRFALDENATPVHGDEWMWGSDIIITDQEGKVLYEPKHQR